MTGGVGDQAMSISPATTARAAAVPLSNGRISTSAPCFLKKPCFSATKTIITEKIGGMPGVAMTTFLPCAAAGWAVISNAARTAPPVIRLKALRIIESSLFVYRVFSSAFQMEFGFAGFAHQRTPHLLAQFSEARLAQRRARARGRQIDGDRKSTRLNSSHANIS